MREKPLFFAKEINQLKESLQNQSLIKILEGVTEFNNGNKAKGVESFKQVKESDPYYELMVENFKKVLIESNKIDKSHLELLCRMVFETDLREEYKLSFGCVKGLDHSYEEMIKDDPFKKANFEKWKVRKLQEFYDAAPGNWYHCLGESCHIDLNRLTEVTDSVEDVLLGFKKPSENFKSDWKKVNSLKAKFFERVDMMTWEAEISYQEILSHLEELRLHVLAGKVTIVNKVSPVIRQHISRYIDTHKREKVWLSTFDDLLSKYYYIQGVHRFLIGKEKQLKELDAREELIGKKGAAVSLYLSTQKGRKSNWVEKSKKLYDHIRQNSEKWFGVKIVDIFRSK